MRPVALAGGWAGNGLEWLVAGAQHSHGDYLIASTMHARVWRPEDVSKPVPAKPGSSELFRPDILEFIDRHIEQSSQELRALSLDIHGIREHSA